MGRVQGKVALVTGAARGQGAEHARLLAREGAGVVIADILDEQGEVLAKELRDSGLRAEYQHLDVSSQLDWVTAVGRAEELFGKLDVLVNNAGICAYANAEECTDEEWQRLIAVNQTGVFLGMRAVLPAMRRAEGGSIINISSIIGPLRAAPGYIGYGASKAAVAFMTQSVAMSHGKYGIRANAIAPGALETQMLHEEVEVLGVTAEELVASCPLGRVAHPSESSTAVLYLASDESSYVTGTLLPVDGGVTLGIP